MLTKWCFFFSAQELIDLGCIMVQQREHDAQVLSYRHLRELPRADEALHALKKIASMVKPIMRARGWNVAELCEFYPSEQNLLGTRACRLLRYSLADELAVGQA